MSFTPFYTSFCLKSSLFEGFFLIFPDILSFFVELKDYFGIVIYKKKKNKNKNKNLMWPDFEYFGEVWATISFILKS